VFIPERFRLYEKEPWHRWGLRQMPVDHFSIFYIPDREDRIVTIIRIMYGGRSIEDHYILVFMNQASILFSKGGCFSSFD
jgi:hypothetical protein